MSAYLFVFGTAYCQSSRLFLQNLLKIQLAFVYCPFDPTEKDEEEAKRSYWDSVRPFYGNLTRFSFPTVLLFRSDELVTEKPIQRLEKHLESQFVVDTSLEGSSSSKVFMELQSKSTELRPSLRATLGCDSSEIAKYFEFVKTQTEAMSRFQQNKPFVFCP